MKHLIVAGAVALMGLATPVAAHASETNGELCSVQTGNENVVITVYRGASNPGPSGGATQAQMDEAYTWCSTKGADHHWYNLNGGGWWPGSRVYDSYAGQSQVCTLSDPAWQTLYEVYANDSGWSYAVRTCNALSTSDPGALTWSQ